MRRFPAQRLPELGEQLLLSAETSHHILRVTLLPRGQSLVLFDGRGRSCKALLVGAPDGLALVEGQTQPTAVQDQASLHLVLGLPRKPALERVLRMSTELGLTNFWPFVARHSVAKGAHPERWAKLVQQAARQSGRSKEPTIHSLASLEVQLSGLPDTLAGRFVLQPGSKAKLSVPSPMALLIGPEGGLHPEEIELASAHGFEPVGLGPGILRSDTAVVAAIARLAL